MDDENNTTNQGFTDADDEEELNPSTDENVPTGEDEVTEGDVAETELPVHTDDELEDEEVEEGSPRDEEEIA